MAIFSLNIAKVSKNLTASSFQTFRHRPQRKWQEIPLVNIVDYRYKMDEPIYSEMLPRNTPPWNFLIQRCYGTQLKNWKNSNALLARRIIVALPVELSLSTKSKTLHDYCMEQFVDKGMCADVPSFTERIHMQHIFANDKTFKENGDWGNKKGLQARCIWGTVPQLDENGNQNSEDAVMRNYGSEYVLTDLSQTRKMAEVWRESWKIM